MSGKKALGAIAIAVVAPLWFSSAPAMAGTAYGPVQQMLAKRAATSSITTETCSNGCANIDGAAIRIVLPPGANQLVTARFSGVGGSTGTNGGGVRIMSGARELLPSSFDTQILPSGFLGLPFALERSSVLVPGPHNIVVQYCVNDPEPGAHQVGVAAWHLTVEAAPAQ